MAMTAITSGNGCQNTTERIARECPNQDFMKSPTSVFQSTEGADRTTHWFSQGWRHGILHQVNCRCGKSDQVLRTCTVFGRSSDVVDVTGYNHAPGTSTVRVLECFRETDKVSASMRSWLPKVIRKCSVASKHKNTMQKATTMATERGPSLPARDWSERTQESAGTLPLKQQGTVHHNGSAIEIANWQELRSDTHSRSDRLDFILVPAPDCGGTVEIMDRKVQALKQSRFPNCQGSMNLEERIMETQAIDDQGHLVNYDNDNENDDLGYQSEEEYGKPDGIKLIVTFDALNRISGKHKALVKSAAAKMARSKSVYQHTMGRGGYALVKEKMCAERNLSQLDNERRERQEKELLIQNLSNKMSQTDGEKLALMSEGGNKLLLDCVNELGIQKSNGLATLEKEMETRECKSVRNQKIGTRSIRKDSSRQDSQSQENVSPLLVLPHDCYKVSIDTSLVDAACIPDVGNNSFKTVKDAVGGFFAGPMWLDYTAAFVSTGNTSKFLTIDVENKTAAKLTYRKRKKNVYVSGEAMQKAS
ncbi:hypothetical protein Tco_1367357 [Tanacetum coccineum]